MFRRVIVLLGLALALPGAASARDGGADIVGGHAPSREYPFQVLVQTTSGGRTYMCGGSLVAARFVVTAAHCVTDPRTSQPAGSVSVAVGIADLRSIPGDAVYHDVGFARHPAFDPATDASDVAVLTLPRPAPQTQLRLPQPADAAAWGPGLTGTAIGWGSTWFDGPTSPDLLEVDIPLISDTQCDQTYGVRFQPATMLCAFEPGKDTCQGDSGGPLLVAGPSGGLMLAGVTSWGDGCGSGPGVYARVGAEPLNAWLRSQVPQVELAAGADTLTAIPRDPYGSGPFGGYDTIDWDLDGDGAFDDAKDVLSVAVAPGARSAVAVRARRADADPARADTEIRAFGDGAARVAVAPPVAPAGDVGEVSSMHASGGPVATARLLGVGRHALDVRLTTSLGGRLRAEAIDGAGRVLARARSRRVRTGAVSLNLRLTRRGRAALRRHRRVRVSLRVTYAPPAGARRIVLARRLTLSR